MLSYQHAYHAGNFADVIKHVTLTHLIHYLIKKDAPLLYLETHAGRGQYALNDRMAKKTSEFKTGILPLWKQRDQHHHDGFQLYLDVIQAINPEKQLIHYPGSPLLAKQLLRSQDRLYLCETHPQELAALRLKLAKKGRLHIAHQDGWEALHALLPPPEKRALIFIDPSFELKDEYRSAPKALFSAYSRFPQGMYCLWYPITAHEMHLNLTRKLKNLAFPHTLQVEFFLNQSPKLNRMRGAGFWIINPPYTLSQTLKPVLDTCKHLFNFPHSDYNLSSSPS